MFKFLLFKLTGLGVYLTSVSLALLIRFFRWRNNTPALKVLCDLTNKLMDWVDKWEKENWEFMS